VVQAILSQWKAVGVTAQLTTDPQIPGWLNNVMSRKFPVVGFGYGNLPTYLMSLDFMRPTPNPFNPYQSADGELETILDRAIAEPEATAQAALFRQAAIRLNDLAWFAPVVRIDGIAVLGSRVTSVAAAQNGLPTVLTVRPVG
jgi:peptide/nickel transport system substrate-binding protein